MLDFWEIAANLTWILGLSVLLATWSYGYYEGQAPGRSARELFSRSGYSAALSFGLVLLCVGLGATEDRWLVRLLWIALAIFVVIMSTIRRLESSSR